jgi:hypothetical protein
MPYNDITAVFTGDPPSEELHIAWVATDWERYLAEDNLSYGARIFHWAESFGVGYDKPRAAATSRLDPILCNAGGFNFNLAKPQISECNGNIYILFVDLWDGHDDPLNLDCSERGYNGDFTGAVNGELKVVISDNGGISFDLPHNLTETPTPMCDPDGAVLTCESDHWPSMVQHGLAVTSSDGGISGTSTLVNPSPAQVYNNVPGSYWLPVMYINDKDPGFVLHDNSTWKNNPVKTFYMACVEPQYAANPWGLCWGYDDDIGWPL